MFTFVLTRKVIHKAQNCIFATKMDTEVMTGLPNQPQVFQKLSLKIGNLDFSIQVQVQDVLEKLYMSKKEQIGTKQVDILLCYLL